MTASWNTDATDVDLWVIEPDGTKCFYQHNRTKKRRRIVARPDARLWSRTLSGREGAAGTYTVIVHYFRQPNLLGGETHVNVVVTRNAGTPQESSPAL